MKQILVENAYEAWAAAIRFCDIIKDGKATLQYQKSFVSSLHNAVELIMKQMLLNNNDHKVARIKKVENKANAELSLSYYRATDLNRFFETLSDEELSKFTTIQFSELIPLHKGLFGESLGQYESLEQELKLLQRLRNNEAHFMIRQGGFLTEGDFCTLYNFMIRFYGIIETWSPDNNDNDFWSIFPYWGAPVGANKALSFDREPLEFFSYENAVKNSRLAKRIAEYLNNDYLYGAPDFSPYTIARELTENCSDELLSQFDEVWAMVYMMESLGMIVVDEIRDDEQCKVHFGMSVRL